MILLKYKEDKGDLKVELSPDNLLTVSYKKVKPMESDNENDDSGDQVRYYHRGIASRNFEIAWKLGPWNEVNDVTFEDGILSITIHSETPEKPKTKLLEIK
jgi:HSP20 family molecular chaperone IbpA